MYDVLEKPWLPDGFSFLSGLPEVKRRHRVIMPIQVFVDESGAKGQSRYFVLIGVMAESEVWASFSDEWKACLQEYPSISAFKMRDAIFRCGEFSQFSVERRDEKVNKLVAILQSHVKCIIYQVYDLDAHQRIIAPYSKKPINEEYFLGFHNMIVAACHHLWDNGLRDKFEIVFDEHVIFGPRAKAWYPVTREAVRQIFEDQASILPVDPIFRSDDDFLPLQAADWFAWLYRRSYEFDDEEKFPWAMQALTTIGASEYSDYFDEDRLKHIAKVSKRYSDNRQYEKLIEIYKETFGD